MSEVLLEAHIPGHSASHRGKVRDTFDLGDRLLIVATDRISAFDVVLEQGIPGKGVVLTKLSAFWFGRVQSVVPTHFLRLADGSGNDDLPFGLPEKLIGRSMIVRKAQRIDAECIARGYLAGSALEEYRAHSMIGGQRAAPGLEEAQQLPAPLFTPTTKAEIGHDQSLSYREFVALVGPDPANVIKLRTLAVYTFAALFAAQRGIIVADTKLEFGYIDGELHLIDEALTPDSSRFWPLKGYRPGRPQPSYDKQPLRDWLELSGWNKQPPPPSLPPEIIASTAGRYREAYGLLTGETLEQAS